MNRPEKMLGKVLTVFLFSLVAVLAAFEINDPDTIQYLAAGKYILAHGFAKTNVFSYTIPNQSLVWSEWLVEVLVYGVYTIGQWPAMVILQILLVVAIFFVIFLINHRQRCSLISMALFFILASLVGAERFMLRADLLAALLAVSFFYLLLIYQEKDNASIYLLPFLTLVWANVHGSFPLVYFLIGVFTLAPLLENIWRKYGQGKTVTIVDPKIKKLFFVLLLCVLASLLNPSGWSAFLWPFKTMFKDASFLSEYNREFQSTLKNSDFQRFSVGYYKLLVSLVLILLVLNWRRWRLMHLLLLAPLLYLSLKSIRHIALLAFFAAGIMPIYLDQAMAKLKFGFLTDKIKGWLKIFAMASLMIIISWFIIRVATNDYYLKDQRTRRFGFNLSELVYPIGAAEFIKENNIGGNGFNNYSIGTYLNWYLFPQKRTFIDGHTAPPEFFKEYVGITRGETPYKEVVEKYQINYFVLNHINSDTNKLVSQLASDNSWAPVYLDELSIIFVARHNPQNQVLIGKYAIDLKNNLNFDPDRLKSIRRQANFSTGYGYRGTFLEHLGLSDQAIYQFKKAVETNPQNYMDHYNLGVIYKRLGQKDEALIEYNLAAKIMPGFALPHLGLAQLYQKDNQEVAIREYKEVLKINKSRVGVHYNLGALYEVNGQLNQAINFYKEEIAFNPAFAPSYFNLGSVYRFKKIDNRKAVYYWQKYLALVPDDPQAAEIKKQIQQISE